MLSESKWLWNAIICLGRFPGLQTMPIQMDNMPTVAGGPHPSTTLSTTAPINCRRCDRPMLDPSQAPENQDMRSHLDQSNIMYYVISCIAEQCRTEQEK